MYQSYLKSLQTGSGLKGVSFWQFEANNQDSNIAMVDIGESLLTDVLDMQGRQRRHTLLKYLPRI